MNTTLNDINLHGVDDKDWDVRKRLYIESLVYDVREGLRLRSIGKLELGKLMLDLKQEVGHGDFEIIRDAYFAIPKRSANRYAAAAKEFWEYRDQVSHLYQNDLQKLAEKEALRELKDSLLNELAAGRVPDAKQLHGEIRRSMTNSPTELKGDVQTEKPSKSRSAAQSDTKVVSLAKPMLRILNNLLPHSQEERRMLADLLSDDLGKKEIIKFMRVRLEELLRQSEPPVITNRDRSTEPKTLDQSL